MTKSNHMKLEIAAKKAKSQRRKSMGKVRPIKRKVIKMRTFIAFLRPVDGGILST